MNNKELSRLAYRLQASGYVPPAGSGGGGVAYTFNSPLSVSSGAVSLGTVPVNKGGTNATSASGTALDNITGFSSTGLMRRTGAGTYSFGTTTSVAEGGTGLTSGTSGGVPAFTASGTITSSAALAANALVLGGGAGAVPATNSKWTVASDILKGNLNAAAAPTVVGGTVLQLNSADATNSLIEFNGFGASAGFVGRRADTSGAAPSAVQSGEVIFTVQARGYGATGWASTACANLQFVAAENHTDSAQGGKMLVRTNPIGSATIATVASFQNTGCTLLGATTNATAAAGDVGEAVSANVLQASAVSLTTATTADVTSISLTAGNWLVWGNVAYDFNGTTATKLNGGISTTSATVPTSAAQSGMYKTTISTTTLTDTAAFDCPTGPVRLSLSATTTVYLVARATFSAGTTKAYGYIEASRLLN